MSALFSPLSLPTGTSFALVDIESSYSALKVELAGSSSEYLLIANIVQTQSTWTQYLPGSRLLVLHIDTDTIDARDPSNTVNA